MLVWSLLVNPHCSSNDVCEFCMQREQSYTVMLKAQLPQNPPQIYLIASKWQNFYLVDLDFVTEFRLCNRAKFRKFGTQKHKQ